MSKCDLRTFKFCGFPCHDYDEETGDCLVTTPPNINNMDKVLAKFKVDNLTRFADGKAGEVTLSPVTTGSEENHNFWKYTPSGILQMHIDNPEALQVFENFGEFYVTIEKAPTE